jgi:CheY-like chemotaxis protein
MCIIRTILIAEDDDNDFIFVNRALQMSGFQGKIVRATDGTSAIELLQAICAHQFELPALALIDLKMPRSDGFEVLTWKQEHRHLPCVPLIVFSSSRLDADVKRAYELGAHAYSTKPFLATDYVEFCTSLQDWWRHCELTQD